MFGNKRLLKEKIDNLENEVSRLKKELDKEILAKSEAAILSQKYRSLFNHPQLGLFQYDINGILTEYNDKFIEIIGSSREKLKDFNMITQAKDKKLIKCVKQVLVEGESFYEDDYTSVTGEKTSTVKAHFVALRNEKNEIIGGIGAIEDITLRKSAEKALKLNEIRFRDIVENINDAFIIHDFTGKIIDINENVTKTTGYKKEDLIGKNISIFGNEELIKNKIKETIENENVVFEEEIIGKSNVKLFVNVNLTVVSLEENGIIHGFIRDITELKKTQINFDRIFNLSTDLVCIANFEGYFLKLNPSFESTLGYTNNELLSKPFFDFIHPDDLEKTRNKIEETLKKKNPVINFTNRYRKKNGEYIWLEWVAHPQVKEEVMYAIGRDITNQKVEEQKLIKDKYQLKIKLDSILSPDTEMPDLKIEDIIDISQLQNIQDAFAKAANVASIIVDINGEPITSPSNFFKLCSLVRQTEKGKLLCQSSNKAIGIQARQLLKPMYEKCKSCGLIKAGAPIIIGNKHIATWMIEQGRPEDLLEEQIIDFANEINIDNKELVKAFKETPVTSNKKVEEVIDLLWILAKEISTLAYNNLKLAKSVEKHKTYENELKRAKNKAEESDKLKTAFLSNMSHEIRTPMNAIIGFTDLLADKDLTAGQREQYIEVINNSGNNLLHIIDDIIDIAKIEADQLKIQILESNINSIFKELKQVFEKQILRDNKRISLNVYKGLPDSEAIILTDGNRLKQVLINLVNNAIKFTKDGKVDFGYKLKDDIIEFYVIDTGIGIETEFQKQIFERFRQESEGVLKKFSGTGLGLTISKGLIELLEGKIWFESETGKGTKFYFTIPYKKTEYKRIVKQKVKEEIGAFDFHGKNVLIVEDDESNFLYLDSILMDTGSNITRAINGQEAFDIYSNNKFDIILMDIQLPILNGYEVTAKIREQNKIIPIIAQTAFAMEEDKEKIIQVGCNDYVSKPIRRKELLEKMNKFL